MVVASEMWYVSGEEVGRMECSTTPVLGTVRPFSPSVPLWQSHRPSVTSACQPGSGVIS